MSQHLNILCNHTLPVNCYKEDETLRFLVNKMNEFCFDEHFMEDYYRFWISKEYRKLVYFPDFSAENRAFPDFNDDDEDEQVQDEEWKQHIIETFGCEMKLYGGHGFDLIFREHILQIKTPHTHLFWQWFVESSENMFITPMRKTLHDLVRHVGGNKLVLYEGYPFFERVLLGKDRKLDAFIRQLRKHYKTSDQRYFKRGEPVNINYLIEKVEN